MFLFLRRLLSLIIIKMVVNYKFFTLVNFGNCSNWRRGLMFSSFSNHSIVAAASSHIPHLRERLSDTELIMWVDPGCVKVQYSHAPKSPQIIYQAPIHASSPTNEEFGMAGKAKSFSVPNSPTILSIRTKNASPPPISSTSNEFIPPTVISLNSNNHLLRPSTPKMKSSPSLNTLRTSLVNSIHSSYYPERPHSPNHHNNTLFIPNYNNNYQYSSNNMGTMYNNHNNMSSNHTLSYERSYNNNVNVFHNGNGFTQNSDPFTTTVV